jgi:hypothetical protein
MARGNVNASDSGKSYHEARRARGASRFLGDGGLMASVDRACTRFLRSRGEEMTSYRDQISAEAKEGLARKRRHADVPGKIESIAEDLEKGWQA